jgi:hypothetical protein
MSEKIVETFTPSSEENRALTEKQSGHLIILDLTNANLTITLPPIKAGLNYEILIKNNNNTLNITSKNTSYVNTALNYVGQLTTSLVKTLTLPIKTPTPTSHLCDRIIINCDGTNWYTTIVSENVSDYSNS